MSRTLADSLYTVYWETYDRLTVDERAEVESAISKAAREAYVPGTIDVHTEHCCSKHGCKYGKNLACTVVLGLHPQSYPCEDCEYDSEL